MKKSKIILDANLLDAISNSGKMDDSEKISFLRYIGYMTGTEKCKLMALI